MGQSDADIYMEDAVIPDHQIDQKITRKYIIARLSGDHSKDLQKPAVAFKSNVAPIDSSGLFKISTQFGMVYAMDHKSHLRIFPRLSTCPDI